eukprot:COSAG03_NODE_11058_length_613_cov_6.778210_2_plen_119_part_01
MQPLPHHLAATRGKNDPAEQESGVGFVGRGLVGAVFGSFLAVFEPTRHETVEKRSTAGPKVVGRWTYELEKSFPCQNMCVRQPTTPPFLRYNGKGGPFWAIFGSDSNPVRNSNDKYSNP